jgi:hypothetical protein
LAELAKASNESYSWPKVSPDGKLLAVHLSKDRINLPASLRLWDLTMRKELRSFPSGGDFAFVSYVFSVDSKQLAAADYNGGVHVWDIATGRRVVEKAFGKEMRLRELTFTPDGRLAVLGQPKWDEKDREPAVRDIPQPRVFLFDLANPAAEPEVIVCPHGHMGGLAVSPDGKMLAVGGAGGVHLFAMTDLPGRKP